MDEFQMAFRIIESLGVALLIYVAIGVGQIKTAVFGPKGDNGMYGDVKELKQWRIDHQLEHAQPKEQGHVS
jgi:hypothetical protein